VRRPDTLGVKCVVRDGDRVLFVRHTYGDRGAWELPGGGRRSREPPADAIRREMREELGIELVGLRALGQVEVEGLNKRTRMDCFEAGTGGALLRLAEAELAEARWAPVHAPPRPLGPDAAAVLGLVGGG
jgi:8-oxo-dGTP pyrophosphatase MutT (NUDIX family)